MRPEIVKSEVSGGMVNGGILVVTVNYEITYRC